MPRVDVPLWGAVIVAAGSGTRFARFSGDVPKQFTLLAGEPVVNHAVKAIKPFVDHLVVVTPPQDWQRWWTPFPGLDTVPGGKRRQDSVASGLNFLKPLGVTHVLIHDGARPFVSPESVRLVMEASLTNPAVIPVVPVRDTVKRVEEGTVLESLCRDDLRLSQTPQGFHLEQLADILAAAGDITDEASAYETAGVRVATVSGSRRNIKLTDREDAEMLSILFNKSKRVIGTGLDFHPFDPDRPFFFCGCRLSDKGGLMGHSDGDVVLHAVADAILSAARLGDIGTFFPPTRVEWKDADSSYLLSVCVEKVTAAGWKIDRLDVTVIGEKPKVSPIRSVLMERLSEIAGIPVEKIWIKGTTTNTIGELARGKGVACTVLAELVRRTE